MSDDHKVIEWAKPVDMVNHPPHYESGPQCLGCGRVIQCIDIVEQLGFSLGNVVKYVWRCPSKGDTLGDLKKARWYLDREIARIEVEEERDRC